MTKKKREDNMQICRLYKGQLQKALGLVWRVFEECDAKDYEEMGISTFRHFISWENMEEMFVSGDMVFFGAYECNHLVGVIAVRGGSHISLLFVDKPYQRQGVAKRLMRRAAVYCMENDPQLKYITVNSSPAGRKAYEAMGFEPLSSEKKKEGMRYTPMRICIAPATKRI